MNSFIGKPVSALPTPALVVDVETLDHNLKVLAGYFASRRAKLRPTLNPINASPWLGANWKPAALWELPARN